MEKAEASVISLLLIRLTHLVILNVSVIATGAVPVPCFDSIEHGILLRKLRELGVSIQAME